MHAIHTPEAQAHSSSVANSNDSVQQPPSIYRNPQCPGTMGYITGPADAVWSTSPYDVVGGWADGENMHTEPGAASGWASQDLDENGVPNRMWRTATPGAVVSLGVHFDAESATDALDRLFMSDDHAASPSSTPSHTSTPDLHVRSMDSELFAQVKPYLGINTAMASRLGARTFLPWKPVKTTVPDEPQPEPEQLVDSIYKMRRFRRVSKKNTPKNVYVSLTGKDSADGSLLHPVQTVDRARELKKLQGATKVLQIKEDGTISTLIDSDAVPQVPRAGIDESAHDTHSPEYPCFLSKFPTRTSGFPPPLPESPAQSVDLCIKNLELQSTREQMLGTPEFTPELLSNKPLVKWSPPRCVASQLLDTQAVLGSPLARSVLPQLSELSLGSAMGSNVREAPSHVPPTPPSAAKPPSTGRSRPALRSRVIQQPVTDPELILCQEAAVVAKLTAQDAVIKSRSAVYAIRKAASVEISRDMDRYAHWVASRKHKAVSINPKCVSPSQESGLRAPSPAKNVKLVAQGRSMSVGVAVNKDGTMHTAPLQRHALEIAMADELPQRMSADDGIVAPSAYAVLYWNGALVGQTQVVHSHRSPRWRHTFELMQIKSKEEGCNFLDVEVWALPATSDPQPLPGDGLTPTPPGTPGSTGRPSSAGSSKIGGSKKLLGKATWKSKPGEFPAGMHVLALAAQKSTFFRATPRPPHISAPVESADSGACPEEDTEPVTSGPRVTIKLIERQAVHTIRRETMQQHEDAMEGFRKEMQMMMKHIEDANTKMGREEGQKQETQLYEAYLSELVDEVVAGAAQNAVVERDRQRQRARWLADVKRAAHEVLHKAIECAIMQVVLGLDTNNEEQAHLAATRLQAVQRGNISRKVSAQRKEQAIEQSQHQAATKIAAVQRGNRDRRLLAAARS